MTDPKLIERTKLAKQIAADVIGRFYREDVRLDDLEDEEREIVAEMVLDVANYLDDSTTVDGGNAWPWGETL
jgi:hypothetical protein